MKDNTRKAVILAAVIGLVALLTAGVTALLVNIIERRQEAMNTYVKFVNVDENTVDAAVWGRNWPRQYDGYLRTAEPGRTKYGGGIGSEGVVPPQKAEKDPWLTRIFEGYLFAIDYRDRRGHAFMLIDQEVTKRNVPSEAKQSGNCLHCHASIMPLYRAKGEAALPDGSEAEQIQKGLELVGRMNYWDAHRELGDVSVVDGRKGKPHPVSCVDCHSPENMELRVTRPGFINGIRAFAESGAPAPHLPSIERWRAGDRSKPYDPNADGMRQEIRSYVCAQCHVEYFCGKGAAIFFPWDRGLKVEEIEAAYNNLEMPPGQRFKDWTHAETGMELLKAQHPEFEVWSQGIHAKSGVACADCHMPYKREGAMKVSEHWVKSPLHMINRSCQTCHPYPEDELKNRVEATQDRHYALLQRAGNAAVDLIDAVKALRADTGRDMTTVLKETGELQRAAQWRLDFVAAENSMGFHAPQELARILGESIDLSRQGQVKSLEALRR